MNLQDQGIFQKGGLFKIKGFLRSDEFQDQGIFHVLSVHVFVGLHQPRSLSFFIFLFLLTAELSDSRLVPEKSPELRRKNAMLGDGGIVDFLI